MKPIKYEIRQDKVMVDEKDFLNDTMPTEMFNFMPEFLEEVYTASNAGILKDANNRIIYYVNKKENYRYIGTWEDKRTNQLLEYYFDEKGNVIAYLIENAFNKSKSKYYPSVGAVAIYENKEVSN